MLHMHKSYRFLVLLTLKMLEDFQLTNKTAKTQGALKGCLGGAVLFKAFATLFKAGVRGLRTFQRDVSPKRWCQRFKDR